MLRVFRRYSAGRAGLSVLVLAAMATVLVVTGRRGEPAHGLIFGLTQAVMGFNLSIAAMLQGSDATSGRWPPRNVVSKLLWGFGVVMAFGSMCRWRCWPCPTS